MIPGARLWIAAALMALTPAAHAAEQQAILGLALDQSAPDPADPGGLKAAFGEDVAANMTGLMMVEGSTPHYQIELKGERKLIIWFDDDQPDRPIYRITLLEPLDSEEDARRNFGTPDFKREGFGSSPLETLLAKFDPTLDTADRATAEMYSYAQAKRSTPPTPTELLSDPGGWTQILGNSFRGQLLAIYDEPEAAAVATELVDTGVAIAVLTRPPQ